MSGHHQLPKDASGIPREPIGPEGERLAVHDEAGAADPLVLLEETLQVSKREFSAGTVRVSTRTETHDHVAEVELDRDVVDVIRVNVGQVIEVAPSVRTEGDITIVPVVEERYVVVKQLYLREELHIRRHVQRDVSEVTVTLRRQTAVVERFDANGQAIVDPFIVPQDISADPAPK